MSMSLYEIDQAILGLADPETGEIEDFSKLDELQMARGSKIENVALWVKDLEVEISAIKAEESNLSDRRHKLENKNSNLKNWLAYALNGQKFESPKVEIRFRRSTAVEIADENALAAWCTEWRPDLLKPVKPEASKSAIRDALRKGECVEGAQLVEHSNISIK